MIVILFPPRSYSLWFMTLRGLNDTKKHWTRYVFLTIPTLIKFFKNDIKYIWIEEIEPFKSII